MHANELLKVQTNTFHCFVQHCLSAIVISKIQAHGKAWLIKKPYYNHTILYRKTQEII